MSGWNGTGGFSLPYNWVNDAANGIDITASRMDSQFSTISTDGFNNTLTRDGQGSASANLPMNGFKHTGVGAATASDQYATAGQIQGSTLSYVVATGTGDAITASFSPAVTVLTDGLQLRTTAPGANTSSAPTFSPNGLTAHPITKAGGNVLVANDYLSAQPIILQYVATGTHWELLNPNVPEGLGTAAYADVGVDGETVVTFSGSLTDNNIARFSGTMGAVLDSGISAAAVLRFTGSLVSGNFPKNSGTAGVQVDSGIAAAALVNFNGSLVSGNLLKNSGTAGLQIDSGIPASSVLATTTIGMPQQGIFFKDTGTVSVISSFGGVSISRTGTGAYDITLGSTALNLGFCQGFGQAVGTGDGWNLTVSASSTMAANGTYSFVGRNASSKTASNASVCLVLFY